MRDTLQDGLFIDTNGDVRARLDGVSLTFCLSPEECKSFAAALVLLAETKASNGDIRRTFLGSTRPAGNA